MRRAPTEGWALRRFLAGGTATPFLTVYTSQNYASPAALRRSAASDEQCPREDDDCCGRVGAAEARKEPAPSTSRDTTFMLERTCTACGNLDVVEDAPCMCAWMCVRAWAPRGVSSTPPPKASDSLASGTHTTDVTMICGLGQFHRRCTPRWGTRFLAASSKRGGKGDSSPGPAIPRQPFSRGEATG
jgi:hypothetical protein